MENTETTVNACTLPGKFAPYKALWQHMIDAGNVAHELLLLPSFSQVRGYLFQNLGFDRITDMENFIAWGISQHDNGKIHPSFISKDPEWKLKLQNEKLSEAVSESGKFRHEKYSEKVIKRLLTDMGMPERYADGIKTVVGLHHQGKKGEGGQPLRNVEKWNGFQNDLSKLTLKYFPFDIPKNFAPAKFDCCCFLLLGILLISDWIASGEMYLDNDMSCTDPDEYMKSSVTRAKEALIKCGFAEHGFLNSQKTFSEMFTYLGNSELRPIQKEIVKIFSESNPDLILIEAGMGEGKTEAAVYSAAKMGKNRRGLYCALPTSATSNQMYFRLNEIDGINNRLLHTNSWIVDRNTPEDIAKYSSEHTPWMIPTRRGLLESNAVGTVDQALLSVLPARYGVLRLLGLSNKVLFIDEVHAYDAYTSGILDRLLEWCAALDIPVIMASATLPLKKKKELLKAYTGFDVNLTENRYPLITTVENRKVKEYGVCGSVINHELNIHLNSKANSPEEIADLLIEKAESGGCVCLIVNTVKKAQAVYRAVKAEADSDIWTGLLHARLPVKDRNEVEKRCADAFGVNGKRPEKAVLVGTQVLEQSLNLDFDEMVSELAPIDLLIQRAGRIHRFLNLVRPKGKEEAALTVLIPENGENGLSKVPYDRWYLKLTLRVLDGISEISVPDDIRELVDKVYMLDDMKDWKCKQCREKEESDHNDSCQKAFPTPDKFSISEWYGCFFSDTDETLSYSTRTGDGSRQIALIEEGKAATLNLEKPDRKTANYVLENSLPLAEYAVCEHALEPYAEPIDGGGLLSGVRIFPAKKNVWCGKKEKSGDYKAADYRYSLIPEIGLVKEGI